MLHGLASSPEAWINTANEVLGDEVLRRGYQIWQVYYPTNAPLPYNNAEIRRRCGARWNTSTPWARRAPRATWSSSVTAWAAS